MACLVGSKAPDVTCEAVMPDGSFNTISLKHFQGKKYVLLFFYPFDFTFVCPSEILAFSKAVADFEARDVQVIGCSIDSKFTHTAWRSQGLKNGGIGPVQIPLMADVTKEVSKAFGVLLPEGMALRGLFLIDKEGIVQHALVNNLSIGRSVHEALRVVDALQHHEKYGDVCPANWQKGEKAMNPTAAGVAEYLGSLH
ncbi:2-Cys peroxiredoxin BAS1, chloroplastic [Cyclospora cayetanensis]|uniref:2-Cys peroxiredoxin BAS1, chloroplastic n=2 Tax=Cyclospora cayetanensis TaxID=88456 RepID=A0A6P5WFI4_9EIME|nr:2-Cys peroxiredoxin BAS1, chloroplastic [Cyclospora cayetanensis]OEH77249.1 putative peroxiredoxin [Cyclospora cayetanensis]